MVGQWRYQHAVLTAFQHQLHGVLLQHHRQHLANRVHQAAKTFALIAVLVGAAHLRAFALAAKGREVAEHRQQRAIQLFGVQVLKAQIVAQHQFGAVDELEHHEVTDLCPADLAIGADALRQRLATIGDHADDFFETRQHIARRVGVDKGRHKLLIQTDHAV